MGCASSKRIEATVDIYRPAPASFAVFDINAVQEPWLTSDNNNTSQEQQEKPAHVPAPILEKLNKFETDAPHSHSWDEVSKVLQDLKPRISSNSVSAASPTTQKQNITPRKSASFHTLEELDKKLLRSSPNLPANAKPSKELRETESMGTELKTNNKAGSRADHHTEGEGFKPVKENIFIVRDRMEREKEGKQAKYEKLIRDPLSDFPEKCPPGGSDGVVIYTTSLRGVRRTYEDCNRVRSIFEVNRVVTDERDVSLHGQFLNELKDLLGGETVTVPRVFIKGRYVGGVDELTELNESGKLGRMLRSARVEMGIGRQACEGCGGARFVPCFDCGGSCKVVLATGDKQRCGVCNENGLVHCPACSS